MDIFIVFYKHADNTITPVKSFFHEAHAIAFIETCKESIYPYDNYYWKRFTLPNQ